MDVYKEIIELFQKIDITMCREGECEKCNIEGRLCQLYGEFEDDFKYYECCKKSDKEA